MQIKDVHKHRHSTVAFGIACFIMQIAIAPNIALGNGRINFALVFCGVYALSVGGRAGVVAGFCSGLVFDLVTTGPFGLMSALHTILAFVLGREARNRFADGFVASLSAFGTGSLACLLAYHGAMVLVGDSASFFDIVFMRTLPSFALTFLCFLPFAYAQVKRAGATHGVGPGGGVSRRGSHYDVSGI